MITPSDIEEYKKESHENRINEIEKYIDSCLKNSVGNTQTFHNLCYSYTIPGLGHNYTPLECIEAVKRYEDHYKIHITILRHDNDDNKLSLGEVVFDWSDPNEVGITRDTVDYRIEKDKKRFWKF